jgi:hypothetical protein
MRPPPAGPPRRPGAGPQTGGGAGCQAGSIRQAVLGVRIFLQEQARWPPGQRAGALRALAGVGGAGHRSPRAHTGSSTPPPSGWHTCGRAEPGVARALQLAQSKASEISSLLGRLSDVNDEMSGVIGGYSDARSHTLARHRDILQEFTQVCCRTLCTPWCGQGCGAARAGSPRPPSCWGRPSSRTARLPGWVIGGVHAVAAVAVPLTHLRPRNPQEYRRLDSSLGAARDRAQLMGAGEGVPLLGVQVTSTSGALLRERAILGTSTSMVSGRDAGDAVPCAGLGSPAGGRLRCTAGGMRAGGRVARGRFAWAHCRRRA